MRLRRRICRRALLAPGALGCALTALACLPGGAGAQPLAAPPTTVDGPSAAIVSLSGLSIARDGTGGLVYLKQVAGVAHVFVSRLAGGSFQAPEEVDAALPGASSQPVLAAGNGGLLTVAFINADTLFEVTRLAGATAFGSPTGVFAGAANPAIQMTNFGKAYLAFTASGAGGHDVRCAYFYNGRWGLESTPLDANPADDAGTSTGSPSVAASGDGVGIVAWGENGHIYSRRVWGTSPSIAAQQADVPSVSGWQEISADEPRIGSGGNSSYAAVAFRETVTNGAVQQTRVLMSRLQAGFFDPATQVDSLATPGPGQADQPQVAVNEYGRGFVTAAHTDSNELFGTVLDTNDAAATRFRVDSAPNFSLPYAAPGIAGLFSTLIAWQEDPGPGGTSEIRVRYAPSGTDLDPELVLSTPAQGPTDAADGLDAWGDSAGDAAVAWVQGPPGGRQIVVAQMYQPPGGFSLITRARYVRTAVPRLAWNPSRTDWGPLRYQVSVDGNQVGATYGTSMRVPAALRDGPHSWDVVAINPAGLTNTARRSGFFVDTVRPTASLKLRGKRQVGKPVHAYVRDADRPPAAEPGARASGIARVVIRWGDRTSNRIKHSKFHVYKRAGRYTITVVVTDRAGNRDTIRTRIRIARGKHA